VTNRGPALMKSILRSSLTFPAATVAAALVSGWLLTGESSPFHDYFLFNVTLPNVWRALNVMPLLLGLLVSGNPHSETAVGAVVMVAAFVAQWALVGSVLSKLFAGLGNGLR
jgi:hypothetical protein